MLSKRKLNDAPPKLLIPLAQHRESSSSETEQVVSEKPKVIEVSKSNWLSIIKESKAARQQPLPSLDPADDDIDRVEEESANLKAQSLPKKEAGQTKKKKEKKRDKKKQPTSTDEQDEHEPKPSFEELPSRIQKKILKRRRKWAEQK